MAKLPVLKTYEVIARRVAFGFVEVRQRGAHEQFRHGDGRRTMVSYYKGRDMSPVLPHKIARDIGIGMEDFVAAS